jgi:HlyD family secretion protein
VAFGSTKTDNVITYTSWLEVDNSDLSLRPGMTAASTIVSTERNNVLLVPNTALRFTPAVASTTAPAASSGGSVVSKLIPRMPPRSGGPQTGWRRQQRRGAPDLGTAGRPARRRGRDHRHHRRPHDRGQRPELKEGMAVITDQRAAGAAP